jgi:hypothetical protein
VVGEPALEAQVRKILVETRAHAPSLHGSRRAKICVWLSLRLE